MSWRLSLIHISIYFSAAALEPFLARGRRLDLAFNLREGSYLDRPTLDLVLKDLRSAGSAVRGRVTVVDRRSTGRRTALLQELLESGGGGGAVIFASTGRRAAILKRRLRSGRRLAFLSSGMDNGAVEMELADVGCRLLVLYDLPLSGRLLEPFFKVCSGGAPLEIWLLYGGADVERNRLLLDLSLPTRSALEETYRAWAEAAASGKSGVSAIPPLQGSSGTVSYTHLDVYKRQRWRRATRRLTPTPSSGRRRLSACGWMNSVWPSR